MERRLPASAALSFFLLTALAVFFGTLFFEAPYPPSDGLRYIDYAVTLDTHGVFGLSHGNFANPPAAGNANTPLYPLWIAAIAALDPGFHDSLQCLARSHAVNPACPLDFRLIITAQLLLAGVTLFAVWLLAKRLTGNIMVAWLAALLALLARAPLEFASQLLTEALLLPLISLFILFLIIAYQDRRPAWLLAAGLMLGLATLTRPAYVYLFYAMVPTLTVAALWRRRKAVLMAAILFAAGFAVTVTPWILRNKLQLDSYALTTTYAGKILAQRVAYNRMSWPQFGVSFLYWFPDFGDNLAKRLFPATLYEPLSWDKGSFYKKDARDIYLNAVDRFGSGDDMLPYFIQHEILANPIKHALVSIALAWRAIFISGYWGVAGSLCFLAMVIHCGRRGDYSLLLASLPVWFMVVFHAAATVSIPRYNLALIPIYATAMAFVAHAAGGEIWSRLRSWRLSRRERGEA